MKTKILLLSLHAFSFAAAFAQTGNPLIKQIYTTNYGREPNAIEYNTQNYNGGHWNNYGELQRYVAQYLTNMNNAGITTKVSDKTFANNTKVAAWYQNGNQIAADLISLDGGKIVARGGGNILAQGGGNIVTQGGGNILAQGGGNIIINPKVKGAGFGAAYTVQADGMKVLKTSGTSALIIK